MSNKKCFVVSQIGEVNSKQRNHSDNVLKFIIKPCLSDSFDIERADTMYHNDKIDDKIFEQLKTADLVIADLTGNNPNVFLEVGYRMALSKPIIYIMQENSEPIPFDIRTTNILKYDLEQNGKNVLESVEKTKNTIKSIVKNIRFDTTDSDEELSVEPNIQQLILEHTLDIKEAVYQILVTQRNNSTQNNEQSFNDKLLSAAFENPEKLEKVLEVMLKFSEIQNADSQ